MGEVGTPMEGDAARLPVEQDLDPGFGGRRSRAAVLRRERGLRALTDDDHPQGHGVDARLAIGVAVDTLVLAMEGLGDPRDVARVDPGEVDGRLDLEALAVIAQVRGRGEARGAAMALAVPQPGLRIARQPAKALAQLRQRLGRERRVDREDEVVLDVGDETSQRRENARCRRNEDRGHPQLAGQQAGGHRAAATEGEQREFAQIDALMRGELADLAVHAGDRDLDHRLGRRLEVAAERRRDRRHRGLRLGAVDGHGAVAEFAMSHEAADDECIGERGPRAAASVACGARCRTGALGTDCQRTERVDGRDRAAACADRGHRDRRNVDRKLTDHLARSVAGLAVDDHGDVGGRAADIERQDARHLGVARHEGGPHRAGRSAGQQHLDALRLAEFGGHHATVRLRDHRLREDACLAQRLLQRADIGGDARLHVAVDDGGRCPFVFADDRPDR